MTLLYKLLGMVALLVLLALVGGAAWFIYEWHAIFERMS